MKRTTFRWVIALAMVLALGLALPAVWFEPLHFDEMATLEFAPHSLGQIVDEVFVGRGGAPFHFFLTHLSLQWPGGIEGLRLPSLLLFLSALPLTALVGRELVGRLEGALAAVALALAPLAVGLATFGRMYSLLLA